MYAPIILFVYNRKNHAEQVLTALEKNRLAAESVLYIFSDAPANEFEYQNVADVRYYLDTFVENNKFKAVNIIKAEKNQGLEKSIISGVTKIINEYGKVIVLEDDIVTSEDFLMFMNQALECYRDDANIWSISGYTINNKRIAKYDKDVFVGERASCWGWASWKDRWDKIDWEVKDYQQFKMNKRSRKAFNRGGADMANLLELQQKGVVNSWAIRWCYQEFKEGMVSIFPKISKVNNIGVDGSGTNCGNHKISAQNLIKEDGWNFEYDIKDRTCFNQFRKMYFFSYYRQKLGAKWYNTLDHKSCIAYKKKGTSKLSYIGLNGVKIMEEPQVFDWNGNTYLFMTEYNRIKNRRCISVIDLDNKTQNKNNRIILDKYKNISFPNVFSTKHGIFMIPNINEESIIKLYKMRTTPYEWEEYGIISCDFNIANIVYLKEEGDDILFCGDILERDNRTSSKILFAIKNIECIDNSSFKEIRLESDRDKEDIVGSKNVLMKEIYLFKRPNLGAKEVKFIIKSKIDLVDNRIIEKERNKIDIREFEVMFKPFIHRVRGLLSYSESCRYEAIEVKMDCVSLMGSMWALINGTHVCKE